jgi:hypothetical protein
MPAPPAPSADPVAMPPASQTLPRLDVPPGAELYPQPAPQAPDVLRALGDSRRKFLADLPAKVVDPTISTRDRLFSGAAMLTGSNGADLDTYEAWRMQHQAGVATPLPPRAGMSPAQAKILASPQDHSVQAKVMAHGADDTLAARVGGWIASYEENGKASAPVDVARFDRLSKTGVLGDGRTKRLYTKLLDGSIDDADTPELSSKVSAVAEALHAFGDDLSIGTNGKLIGVDADSGDVRLRVRYSEGDEPVSSPGALATLPGDWMPQSALRGDGPKGNDLDLYVGGADAVVIAKTGEQIDHVYRRGFPALEGDKGARWMSARPVLVTDFAAVDTAAARNPTARVDTHFGVYPGFLPYDSIVFDMDQPNQRLESLGAVRLGRGVTNGPKLSPRGVTAEDLIDDRTTGDLLDTVMWAVFPGDAKLNSRYTPIAVTNGDRTGRLVFGISPAEASEVADWAFVNDGIATRRDDYEQLAEAEDGVGYWRVATGDHKGSSFAVSTEESPLIVARRTTGVDRWHFPVDERTRPYVAGLADHFDKAGARNLVAYVSAPQVDGFERSREHVYGDGGSGYQVARTADPTVGDPNGLPVWVRRADEYPRKWLQVSPEALDSKVEEMTATLRAGMWRVDAKGMDDIAAQVRAAHVLAGRYGYDHVELVGDDGPITLARAKR